MANTLKILRTSIHSFFCHYQTLTSLATLLLLPFSAATLLSPSTSPLHPLLKTLNFPPNSRLFDILALKISQTLTSLVFSLPFSLTLLPLSQASIISALKPSPILPLYPPLLLARILASLIILASNVAFFSLFSLAREFPVTSFLASNASVLVGGLAYSAVIANAVVVCNLAGVVSAMEGCGGYAAVIRACVLVRGRGSVALTLALGSNLVMGGIEGLFRMRVVRVYGQNGIFFDLGLLVEAGTIVYIYSVVRVLDIIVSCCFYRSCRDELVVKYEGGEKSEVDV